jgi:hypothetical protein
MENKINKHILFFSDNCFHCTNLINLIHTSKTFDNYKFISVDNPSIKIPEIIEKVPTLIVKGMNKPLIGKEVFNWIQSQQFINLSTNNITTTKNPNFKLETTNGRAQSNLCEGRSSDINYISLTDNEDELNKKLVNFNKLNELFITEDINKVIKDHKINQELQSKKLSQLLGDRTNQIDVILNYNKQFTK